MVGLIAQEPTDVCAGAMGVVFIIVFIIVHAPLDGKAHAPALPPTRELREALARLLRGSGEI